MFLEWVSSHSLQLSTLETIQFSDFFKETVQLASMFVLAILDMLVSCVNIQFVGERIPPTLLSAHQQEHVLHRINVFVKQVGVDSNVLFQVVLVSMVLQPMFALEMEFAPIQILVSAIVDGQDKLVVYQFVLVSIQHLHLYVLEMVLVLE